MVAVIVGLGSMGRRRIRLLRIKYPEYTIFGVDTQDERRKETEETFPGVRTFASIADVCTFQKPDIGFVCTAPLSHSTIIGELLARSIHVFTEINLVTDDYAENLLLAKEKKLVLFLSSTFLYRNDIKYIKERVKGKSVNYSLHVGQYLPDWHPWEHYLNFFVGNKRTNACREHFAIDMPWMLDVFGEIKDFHVLKGKNSSLEIDYCDNYIVTFEHEGGTKGVMFNDIISRKGGRNLEVFSEELHIFWNGSPDTLFDYDITTKQLTPIQTYTDIDKNALYNSSVIENAYLDEIIEFIGVVEAKISARYSFEKDKKLLELIDRLEGFA